MARIRFRRPFRRVEGAREGQATTRGCEIPRRGETLGAEPGDHPSAHWRRSGPLLVVVIVLAIVLFSGGGGHKYTFLFQNAGQLVNDNQVLIGGSPVGTVASIELSPENLAEVNVEVEQELHEGTTAVIRATSLSGVANHYVSISPGPEQQSGARRRGDPGPLLDHDPGRHRPALQQLPAEGASKGCRTSSRATGRSTPGAARKRTKATNTSARR